MTTLRTVSVRTMLVDCIKRYKKVHEDWYKRPYTEAEMNYWQIGIDGQPSVKDIVDHCVDAGYDLSKVFVDASTCEDWNGYTDFVVTINERRKVTDKEWFDEVANALSPQWQYDRYKQYVELEKEFK